MLVAQTWYCCRALRDEQFDMRHMHIRHFHTMASFSTPVEALPVVGAPRDQHQSTQRPQISRGRGSFFFLDCATPTSVLEVALPVVVEGSALHQNFQRGRISGGR